MSSEQNQAAAAAADDEEIVLRIMDREELGVRQLLAKYGGKVKALLRWKFGAQLDAEDRTDVLHRAATRAWKYIEKFDESKGSLWAWFAAIAQNQAIDLLQEERLPVVELEQDPPTATDDAEELTPERRQLFEDLDRIIEGLPKRQREVAKEDLRCGGEADGPELGKKLGASSNAIRVARSKYRKTIAEEMKRLGHELGGDA